jgi:AAA domain
MKSFQLAELLTSVATGLPAFGHYPVHETGDVVFCLAEDPGDMMRVRIPALWAKRGLKPRDDHYLTLPDGSRSPGRFYLIDRCPKVAATGDMQNLVRRLRDLGIKPKMIGVDTAAKALTGLDQDDAMPVGLLITGAEQWRAEFGCAVWICHHPRKGDPHDPRGSGAFTNDGDILIESLRTTGTFDVMLHWHKFKNGPKPTDQYLRGTIVEFEDEEGEKLSAPVFDHVEAHKGGQPGGNFDPRKSEATALRAMVLDALRTIAERYVRLGKDVPIYATVKDVARLTVGPGPELPKGRRETEEDLERRLDNEIQKVRRGVTGRSDRGSKAGILSDLVDLDQRGVPIEPYQFLVAKALPDTDADRGGD